MEAPERHEGSSSRRGKLRGSSVAHVVRAKTGQSFDSAFQEDEERDSKKNWKENLLDFPYHETVTLPRIFFKVICLTA